MTPGDLLKLFRIEVDDTKQPYLWSDDLVYSYMDYAQKEFARLTYLFSDASTDSIVTVAVSANTPFVDLSPLILRIRHAALLSTMRPIDVTTLSEMQVGYTVSDYGTLSTTTWDRAIGSPKYFVTDIEIYKGRLVPIPQADDTINLIVYRLPLEDLTSASTELEIVDTRYQRDLILLMKSMAYGKHDSDVYNEDLADKYFKLFTARCDEVYWELSRARASEWATRSAWK
jgi:hypothetical protein